MKYLTLLIVLVIVATGIWFVLLPNKVQSPSSNTNVPATSFTECVEQGNPVMESYPRQCNDTFGNHFVEDITTNWESTYSNASEDLIVVDNLAAGDTISSPLIITGRARGYWFFEASFPIIVVDWDGRIVAEGYAQTSNDWMTEDFVPFIATIEFATPEAIGLINRGAIILHRDNPSDLRENDAALEIPVRFE